MWYLKLISIGRKLEKHCICNLVNRQIWLPSHASVLTCKRISHWNINFFIITISCDVTLHRPVEIQNFKGMYSHHLQGWRLNQTRNQQSSGNKQTWVSLYLPPAPCLVYSSTMKIESVHSSAMPADFYQITPHCTSESTLFRHWGENLKSNRNL
jgi:hypothetical protein